MNLIRFFIFLLLFGSIEAKNAIVIQNYVDGTLGKLEQHLIARGFRIETFRGDIDDLSELDPIKADLLIVLGGPQSATQTEHYPYLEEEITMVQKRLANHKPTLGICLGGQLIAKALGGEVFTGDHPEIGWITLKPSKDSLLPLNLLMNTQVFTWHKDGFIIPTGASTLAQTTQYNQAFTFGDHTLALQFHPEVTLEIARKWYVFAKEGPLDTLELDIQNQAMFSKTEAAIDAFWQEYLDWLDF